MVVSCYHDVKFSGLVYELVVVPTTKRSKEQGARRKGRTDEGARNRAQGAWGEGARSKAQGTRDDSEDLRVLLALAGLARLRMFKGRMDDKTETPELSARNPPCRARAEDPCFMGPRRAPRRHDRSRVMPAGSIPFPPPGNMTATRSGGNPMQSCAAQNTEEVDLGDSIDL